MTLQTRLRDKHQAVLRKKLFQLKQEVMKRGGRREGEREGGREGEKERGREGKREKIFKFLASSLQLLSFTITANRLGSNTLSICIYSYLNTFFQYLYLYLYLNVSSRKYFVFVFKYILIVFETTKIHSKYPASYYIRALINLAAI